MLKFKDFVPQMTEQPGWLREGTYESFDLAVDAANIWITESHIEVINIETVVLPNLWSRFEEGSTDSSIGTSGDSPSRWNQFLRCWYRE
ncbi:MAG: hypothetical protein P8M80_12955 [Pirellulaceae bacterium]|nr:hypothetical protein [Pirellulaceae bacterium]